MGIVYTKQAKYDQALDLVMQALAIWQKLGYKHGEALATDRISRIYEKQHNYTLAIEWYQKALTIREILGNQKHIDEIRQRIANLKQAN